MGRKQTKNWPSLISQQQQSGLTVAEFCREHKLTRSNFYHQLAQLKLSTQTNISPPAFIKLTSSPVSTSSANKLRLNYHQVFIDLPHDVSAQWLAQLLRSLA